jgi:ubiquinone biosynthesis protein
MGKMKALFYYLFRTSRIIVLTCVFLLRFSLSWMVGSSSRPRLLRKYFEAGGTTLVKLGQILAMRYDLLSTEYCQELSTLLDRLPASPTSDIIATIEKDLGKPMSELFGAFDSVPLSSASVAQVHAASTLDGRKVVVKVKHPGIGLRYWVDLTNLRIVAHIAAFLGLFRELNIQSMVREFTRLAQEELDFSHEARNIHVLHELMNDDDIDHCAPAVDMMLCGPSVITMQRFEGVWMTEFLAAVERQDVAQMEAWRAKSITTERTSRLLFRSMLEQCFTHRTFHADPHAGNLVILEGGTLGYVDFGMVGWLDEKIWVEQYKLNKALAAEKVHLAYEVMLEMLEPLPCKDLSDFEMEVKTLLKEWLFANKVPGASIQERSNGALFMRLFEILRQHGLSMSLGAMRLIRALMISDVICLRLYPDLQRQEELQSYFDERLEKELQSTCAAQLSIRATYSLVIDAIKAFQTAPKVVEWLSARLPQLARQYREEAKAFEQAAGLVLRYLRFTAYLSALAIVFGRIVAMRVMPASSWAGGVRSLGSYWLLVTVGMVMFGAMMGAVRNKFP